MKLKKILTLVFLICISILCFFGCAKIESFRMVTYDEDGKGIIVDRLVVTLDKKQLGNKFDNVRNSVHDDMVFFRNYVYEWIGEFQQNHTDTYQNLIENISCEVVESSDVMLSTTLTFSDANSFAMFYGIINAEEGVDSKAMNDVGPFLGKLLNNEFESANMGLFLYKYQVINSPSLVGVIPDFKIDEIGTNYYEKYVTLTGCGMNDLDISQVFVYPTETFAFVDDKVHNNADVIEETDGHTFLAWDLSDKGEDFELSLYKLSPRTLAWYVLGLVVSIVVVIVSFIVIVKKKNNKIEVKITRAEAEKSE